MAGNRGRVREWLGGMLLPLVCCGVTVLWVAATRHSSASRAAAGQTLCELIRDGDSGTVMRALERGADVNVVEPGSGFTPLMCAARYRRHEIARALLAKGADLHAVTRGYGTPLANAAAAGGEDMVRLLLGHGADPNAPDPAGYTPLMCAAGAGDEGAVRALLRFGADVNARDCRGNTALIAAAGQAHRGVMRQLVAAGADVHARTVDGATADATLRDAEAREMRMASARAPSPGVRAAGGSRLGLAIENTE